MNEPQRLTTPQTLNSASKASGADPNNNHKPFISTVSHSVFITRYQNSLTGARNYRRATVSDGSPTPQ